MSRWLVVQLGCGRMLPSPKTVPSAVLYGCVGEKFGWLSSKQKNKIISHPLNICTGSWRQFPVIRGEESTYVLLRLRTRRLTIPTVKRTRDIWSRHSWAFLFSSAPFNSVKTYGFMDSSCKTIAHIAVRRWWRSAAGQQLRPSAEMFQPLHRKEVNVDVTPSSGRLWRLRKHSRLMWLRMKTIQLFIWIGDCKRSKANERKNNQKNVSWIDCFKIEHLTATMST